MGNTGTNNETYLLRDGGTVHMSRRGGSGKTTGWTGSIPKKKNANVDFKAFEHLQFAGQHQPWTLPRRFFHSP
jgi:hypothetical protein